jgi:hypothetical protein
MVEPDAAPARVLNAQHAPGRRRAPPGGQYAPPARSWLTDGRQGSLANEKRARRRKEDARN